jgi:hypothetical protein
MHAQEIWKMERLFSSIGRTQKANRKLNGNLKLSVNKMFRQQNCSVAKIFLTNQSYHLLKTLQVLFVCETKLMDTYLRFGYI